MAKFPDIGHFSNQHDGSLGGHKNATSSHFTQKLRNSSIVYSKSKNPFGANICINISFQLLLYNMKVRRINSFVV